jgi:hypothetical protein
MKSVGRILLAASVALGGLMTARAQLAAREVESAQSTQPPSTQPKIQVNFLNTCRPPQTDLDEMGRALARVKGRPSFSADFEISRGVTTLTEAEARAVGTPSGPGNIPSRWVRIRRELPEKAVLTDVQYSLSVEGNATSEVLAMHLRETSEVLQILISDSVAGTPEQVVSLDTPPDRIRIERFGKGSIVLARCAGTDQSAYEPIFASAREILEKYRAAMAAKTIAPAELGRLPKAKESKTAAGNH